MSLIKSQYRLLAKRYHPDKNAGDKDAEAKFKFINEAYHHLSDAYRRKVYDRQLEYEVYKTTEVKQENYEYRPPSKTPEEIKKDKHFEYLSFSLFVGCCFLIITLIIGFIDKKDFKFQVPDAVYTVPIEKQKNFTPDETPISKILIYERGNSDDEVRFLDSENHVVYTMPLQTFYKQHPVYKSN